MEFLKSCITNVQVVEQLLETPWSRYRLNEDKEPAELLRVLAALRALNVLCVVENRDILIFGELSEQHIELLEPYEQILRLVESGRGDESSGTSTRQMLLNAIEGAIAFAIQDRGMLHVGSWSWLFSPTDDGAGDIVGMLVRVHPNLTDHGTLYLATTTHVCPLQPTEDLKSLDHVILAPSGRTARLISSTTKQNDEGGKSKKFFVGSEIWKQRVIAVLATEDLFIKPEDEWATFELLEGEGINHHVLWPVRLCLTRTPITNPDGTNWKYWFSNALSQENGETYHDPLAEAERWSKDASHEAMVVNEVPDAAGDGAETTVITESPLATSPPFNQRASDNQAAILGIYPTPPDGLLPAQTHPYTNPQHSYTSDGGGAEYASHADQTQFLSSDGTQQDSLQSLDSSGDAQTYRPDSLPVDDLFGDIDGIDDSFGANDEVGDADFDYFDAPDEIVSPDLAREVNEREHDIEMGGNSGVQEESTAHDESGIAPLSDSVDENLLATDPNGDSGPFASPLELTNENREITTDAPLAAQEAALGKQEKPLSPFGIRERLLPPPIPASASVSNHQQNSYPERPFRRSSTFDPLSFNEGLNLGAKYSVGSRHGTIHDSNTSILETYEPNIMLPSKRKKTRFQHTSKSSQPESGDEDLMESPSSVDDSHDDSTSSSEVEEATLPPRLPWETKKRKRDSFALDSSVLATNMVTSGFGEQQGESKETVARLAAILSSSEQLGPSSIVSVLRSPSESRDLPTLGEVYQLTKLDLVYIAQIVSEQAVTATASLVELLEDLDQSSPLESSSKGISSTLRTLITDSIQHILSTTAEITECGLARLALAKEAPSRMPSATTKSPQTPHPRPPFRDGSMHLGPDYFAIPVPYIQVQRGVDTWEMLPPALSFWSSLGLGPANGSKDVRVVSIVPEGLKTSVKPWVIELGRVYEGCKLGSFDTAGTGMQSIGAEINEFHEGVVEITLDGNLALDVRAVLKSYARLCTRLGKGLAKIGHLDPDRTLVVCFFNPFEKFASSAMQHLSASFWHLCKAYRDNIPKAHRSLPRSDVVMQILPISLIASLDRMVMLDSASLGTIAIEMYDRCPPSSKIALESSSSSYSAAAPAVELARMLPRRLVFQLTAEPPGDLMHENSILHLAYSISKDGDWMMAVWVDNSGHYQRTMSLCLRGKSFKAAAAEIWERTMEIIAARDVTWRIFVAAGVTTEIDDSVKRCWRHISATKPRKQMLHVTLLSVKNESAIQLKSPASKSGNMVTTPVAGFLTPASTPQGAALTTSPDANGQTPSDAATTTVENDPDAHLLDLADESWGMLLAPPFVSSALPSGPEGMHGASGLLFRRGESADVALETLRVDLHFDLRVRPNGSLDDCPPRQAEANLREVLRMYRNLSLLGKAREISGDEAKKLSGLNHVGQAGLMPLHVLSCVKGTEALDGFLGREKV